MNTHPTLGRLADLAEGRLPKRAAAEVDDHARACGECSGSLGWLRETAGLLAAGAADEPPRAVIRSAVRIRALRHVRRTVGALREIVARLVPPDARLAPVPSLRGGVVTHRLYRAGSWEIDLSVTGDVLRGTVVRVDDGPAPSGTALLVAAGREGTAAGLDARGRLRLDLPSGRPVDLILRLGGVLVRIEDVTAA